MDRRLTLVGQAPGPSGPRPGGTALDGRCGRRLARLAGLGEREYLGQFRRLNLLRTFPGKAGKGDRFPAAEAREAAGRIARRLLGRRVVFVGKAVAEAFGFRGPMFEWRRHRGMVAARMPHPSGVCTWWNSKRNIRLAGRFMKSLATKSPRALAGSSTPRSPRSLMICSRGASRSTRP